MLKIPQVTPERVWRLPVAGLAYLTLLMASASLLTGQEKPPEATKSPGTGQPGRDYRFEVASIRPGDPNGRLTGPPAPSSPRRFTAESATIASLAMRAFGLKQMFQIECPPWMLSTHFNINAVIPEGERNADVPIMIQHLLEDRFALVFHRETRHMAGYELVVAKSGSKLARSTAPPSGDSAPKSGQIEMKNGAPQFTKNAGSGHLLIAATMTAIWRGRNKTMNSLGVDIASELRAPVRDVTGLEGEYDYILTFTPEAALETLRNEPQANPLLRDALQAQLGLNLQPVKDVRVEVIVLDSARKEPTEN